MRHDDIPNGIAADPALGPASGERGAGSADLYLPGDDDIELIDQADAAEGEGASSDTEGLFIEAAPQFDPGDGDGGESDPSSPEFLGGVGDGVPPPFSSELSADFLSQEPLFDASGELIVESSLDRPAEGRVSVPPPRFPSGAANQAPFIPPPAPLPSESSPWAAEGEAAIDVAALPSAHSPTTSATKPSVKPPPAVADEPSGTRSWLTIFLIIALVASSVTFLILRFNVGQAPSTPPGSGAPIQVPRGDPAPPPLTAAPLPETILAPTNTAPMPSVSSVAADPNAVPSAEPSEQVAPVPTAISIPTVMVTTSPAVVATGVAGAPTTSSSTSRPVLPTYKPTKKSNRIF